MDSEIEASLRAPPRPRTNRRRYWVITALIVLAALGALGISVVLWEPESTQRSIVIVTFDTTRADRIGAFGRATPTSPNFDRLAQMSVLYMDAEAPSPLTLPSHATLMTGLLPAEHGLIDNGIGALGMDAPTLAEALNALGYDTAAFVSAEPLESRFGLDRGFARYDDGREPGTSSSGDASDNDHHGYGHGYGYSYSYGYGYDHGGDYEATAAAADGAAESKGARIHLRERAGAITVDRALAWMATAKRPFFLWVHLFEPHHPYEPAADFKALLVDPYDGEIRTADRQLGRLLTALEDRDELSRSFVVVAADHGEGLGEHGEDSHALLTYRTTQHVPLLLHIPASIAFANSIEQPVQVQAPASLADVAPTLATLVGAKWPASPASFDLLALAQGKRGHDRLLGESRHGHRNFGWAPIFSWRADRWRLIAGARDELFDLATDPGETHDLASENPELVAELRAAMDGFLAERQSARRSTTRASGSASPYSPYTSTGADESPLPTGPEQTVLRDPRDGLDVARSLDQIKAALAAGDARAARTQATALLESESQNAFLRVLLARACKAEGDFAGARKAFEDALALNPRNPEVFAGLLDIRIHALDRVVDSEERQRELASLAADADSGLAESPGSAALIFNRARIHRLHADFANAIKGFTQALEMGLRAARAPLAEALMESGARQRALSVIAAGDPRDAKLKEVRGLLLMRALKDGATQLEQGATDAAFLAFSEAVAIDPTSLLAQRWLARHHLAKRDLEAALIHAVECVKLEPRSAEERVLLATIFGSAGRKEEALEHLKVALDVNPEHAEARSLYERLGGEW